MDTTPLELLLAVALIVWAAFPIIRTIQNRHTEQKDTES
jgi:hypothetical protein